MSMGDVAMAMSDREFRDWVKAEYDWLRIIYVPACCTPSGQPMDAGLMSALKALLRGFYNKWVCGLVAAHLKAKKNPTDLVLDFGATGMKARLAQWLSGAHALMKKDLIVHAWKRTVGPFPPSLLDSVMAPRCTLHPRCVRGSALADGPSRCVDPGHSAGGHQEDGRALQLGPPRRPRGGRVHGPPRRCW